MMYITKNFDNFNDAEKFEKMLKSYGADTKLYAAWSRKDRCYNITVNAVVR